jgi:hypothetical protein
LEGHRGIGKSKGHYQPFKRAIASAEGSLPFFTFCDVNKVIGVTKVDFGVGVGFPRGINEVGDEGKGISIFLGDLVEPAVVHAQSETSVFFPHEEDRSSMWRVGGSDETAPNVVFNEGSEGTQLQQREEVHATRRRSLTFLKVNFEVVRAMFRECFSALPLLKTSENSWYSSGVLERSIGSLVRATDLPESISFARLSWKL